MPAEASKAVAAANVMVDFMTDLLAGTLPNGMFLLLLEG
jgi:hypothetical protein